MKKNLYLFSVALVCAGIFACTTAEYEADGATAANNHLAEMVAVEVSEPPTTEAFGPNVETDAFQASSKSEEGADSNAPTEEEIDQEDGLSAGADVAEPAAFRVSQFGIMSPPLCVTSDDDSSCHNVDMMVNNAFDSMLNDEDSPMDLLGIFESPPLNDATHISFGTASCERVEGEIISCTPVGPSEFSVLSISETEECVGGTNGMERYISPPCFVTEAKDIQLVMEGMFIGLLDAQIMGTLEQTEQGYDISEGHITGFVPEFMAQNWSFKADVPGTETEMSFDQLFHRTACHPNEDGEMGWNLVLGFSGAAVPLDAF